MKPDFEKGNGLIPAIVQDVKTKDVLMLAYVNEEAYERMLTTKETYFYSRSRQELWHKGETSGHFQYIQGMYLDCDEDTLLILVEQVGAACHTGAYSCFFQEVIPYIFEKNIFVGFIKSFCLKFKNVSRETKKRQMFSTAFIYLFDIDYLI